MNDKPDNHDNDDYSLVSAEYRRRAAADVPEMLDDKVLRFSRQAIGRRSFARMTLDWARPLAFAATAILSLTLLLEIRLDPNADISDSLDQMIPFDDQITDSGGAAAFGEAISGSGLRLQELQTSSESIQQNNSERSCSVQQTENADAWWQCISELQGSGDNTGAQMEHALFVVEYPDYEPPQQ